MQSTKLLKATRERLWRDWHTVPRAGVVWIADGISIDFELLTRPAYLAPSTPYALLLEQVLELPELPELPELQQAEVAEAWVRANFEPASDSVQMALGGAQDWTIGERLQGEFRDQRTGSAPAGVTLAASRLTGFIWFLKSSDDNKAREAALSRLRVLEDALRSLPRSTYPNLHNDPPEAVDESPLSSASVDRILAKIEETKQQLLSLSTNKAIVEENTRYFLEYTFELIKWLGGLGDTLARSFVKALGTSAGKSVGAAFGAAATATLITYGPGVATSALHAVSSLQALWPFSGLF